MLIKVYVPTATASTAGLSLLRTLTSWLQLYAELWQDLLHLTSDALGRTPKWVYSKNPQLPFKRPQIPSNGDRMALTRGTSGGVGEGLEHCPDQMKETRTQGQLMARLGTLAS